MKYHTKYVCSAAKGNFIQAGIMDISESIVLRRLLKGTSVALERAAEAADEDTGEHVRRINAYAARLATILGRDDLFVDRISHFAGLHDIGKIKVAGLIKLPRSLTRDEFEQVKLHTAYGGEIVNGLDGLEMAYDIATEHHEKFDGSGYPGGKRGDEISLPGKIVAIADVFDALVSSRVYKQVFSYQEAFEIITRGDGRVMPGHFDPGVLTAFAEHYGEFVALHENMKG